MLLNFGTLLCNKAYSRYFVQYTIKRKLEEQLSAPGAKTCIVAHAKEVNVLLEACGLGNCLLNILRSFLDLLIPVKPLERTVQIKISFKKIIKTTNIYENSLHETKLYNYRVV